MGGQGGPQGGQCLSQQECVSRTSAGNPRKPWQPSAGGAPRGSRGAPCVAPWPSSSRATRCSSGLPGDRVCPHGAQLTRARAGGPDDLLLGECGQGAEGPAVSRRMWREHVTRGRRRPGRGGAGGAVSPHASLCTTARARPGPVAQDAFIAEALHSLKGCVLVKQGLARWLRSTAWRATRLRQRALWERARARPPAPPVPPRHRGGRVEWFRQGPVPLRARTTRPVAQRVL